MQRAFWFGIALFTAFGSIYAGLFGLKWLQYPLIAMGCRGGDGVPRAPAATAGRPAGEVIVRIGQLDADVTTLGETANPR